MGERAKQAVLGLMLLVMLLTFGNAILRGLRTTVDSTDYLTVAERFITGNTIIARKIGRVERLDLFGDGGDAGRVSYNVYRVTGEKMNAVCHVTLTREDRVNWKVTEAVLTVEGADYKIPVQKAEPGKRFRFF